LVFAFGVINSLYDLGPVLGAGGGAGAGAAAGVLGAAGGGGWSLRF
ncbi:MAG: hypothetical protein RL634_478, partial [Bacteroidota bacterium]